jgi:hypothetical protein
MSASRSNMPPAPIEAAARRRRLRRASLRCAPRARSADPDDRCPPSRSRRSRSSCADRPRAVHAAERKIGREATATIRPSSLIALVITTWLCSCGSGASPCHPSGRARSCGGTRPPRDRRPAPQRPPRHSGGARPAPSRSGALSRRSPRRWPDDEDPVFPAANGSPLMPNNVFRRVLQPARDAANLPWSASTPSATPAPRSCSRKAATPFRSSAGSAITRPRSRSPPTSTCSTATLGSLWRYFRRAATMPNRLDSFRRRRYALISDDLADRTC